MGFPCSGIVSFVLRVKNHATTQSTTAATTITIIGNMACSKNSRDTTAISTTTRTKLTEVAIMITVTAGGAAAATRRDRLAKLTVVAVLEIVPPSIPPMTIPACCPKNFQTMYPLRLMPTTRTTINQASCGFNTSYQPNVLSGSTGRMMNVINTNCMIALMSVSLSRATRPCSSSFICSRIATAPPTAIATDQFPAGM